MVVALLQRELQLDAAEEGRGRVEGETVGARSELLRERCDAPVCIGLARGDHVFAVPELYANPPCGASTLGVEHVGRDRDHGVRS